MTLADELALKLREVAEDEEMPGGKPTPLGELLLRVAQELELQELGLIRLRTMLFEQNERLEKQWLSQQSP